MLRRTEEPLEVAVQILVALKASLSDLRDRLSAELEIFFLGNGDQRAQIGPVLIAAGKELQGKQMACSRHGNEGGAQHLNSVGPSNDVGFDSGRSEEKVHDEPLVARFGTDQSHGREPAAIGLLDHRAGRQIGIAARAKGPDEDLGFTVVRHRDGHVDVSRGARFRSNRNGQAADERPTHTELSKLDVETPQRALKSIHSLVEESCGSASSGPS